MDDPNRDDDLIRYLEDQASRFESDLLQWLRIPSIGTDSRYDRQTRQAGEWIADKFRQLGLATELIETEGHPLVFAETPPVAGAPVVLVYGHYDVQPPDPLELWTTPPFEPDVRDGKVFARGATDDKGQFITHLFAVEAWLKSRRTLPLQIKFLVEGEEESGGAGIKALLNDQLKTDQPVREKIAADVAVISDCSQYAPGQPAITHGLRGMLHCEINLTGPARDLHSGNFGGAVANPANVICRILAQLIDQSGRIQIPGFYDDVAELTESEQQQLRRLEFSDADYQIDLGVGALAGETGYSTLERRWCRPTCDIHGLWSGYQGAGAKTVLPAAAGAKFSFRLVPRQDPARIKQSLSEWLTRACPAGIEMEVKLSAGTCGYVLSLESPFVAAAATAIERGFGTAPVFIRSGGSIPIVTALSSQLGIDTLLLGWGQDDDNLHSPNEKFSLADFHAGIATSCFLIAELGAAEVGG